MNLVRRAPVREDVPHDAAFAELRDEIQGAMLRRQLPALGEAAQGEEFPVRRAHVPLVRAVFADASDEGSRRKTGRLTTHDTRSPASE
jgi:hypothetical protein